jgi:hypothetical protein
LNTEISHQHPSQLFASSDQLSRFFLFQLGHFYFFSHTPRFALICKQGTSEIDSPQMV